MKTTFTLLAVPLALAFAVACSDSASTAPTAPAQPVMRTASFGKNPGAGSGGGGGNGGGGGGGAANCGQPLVTFSHGAQFAKGCSFQSGCIYFPVNAAARALAPKGLDLNCNPIV